MSGLLSATTSTANPKKPRPIQNRRGGRGIVKSEALKGVRSKGSNGVYRRPMRSQPKTSRRREPAGKGFSPLLLGLGVPVLGCLGGQLLGHLGALDHGVDEPVLDRFLG